MSKVKYQLLKIKVAESGSNRKHNHIATMDYRMSFVPYVLVFGSFDFTLL